MSSTTFPSVELRPGETIFKADEKVEKAFETAGLRLVALDGLNSFLEIGPHCHFFQAPIEEGLGIVVVHTGTWEERTLLQVLNVLLGLRMDPDPPGTPVRVVFYSIEEVPKVLTSIFGDTACCRFECAALLGARFGQEIGPAQGVQLAAMASFLGREQFGVEVTFDDAEGARRLDEEFLARFRADDECEEPVNSLIAIGCLFGEIVRGTIQLRSAWEERSETAPWPAVVFRVDGDGGEPVREVVFNPIGHTIRWFQSQDGASLEKVASDLARDCEAAVS